MNVHLHIERLILDGLPVEAGEASAVQAVVEAELARLIAERGLAPVLQRGGALAYARGGDLHFPARHNPEGLGEQIGRAVVAGLTALDMRSAAINVRR